MLGREEMLYVDARKSKNIDLFWVSSKMRILLKIFRWARWLATDGFTIALSRWSSLSLTHVRVFDTLCTFWTNSIVFTESLDKQRLVVMVMRRWLLSRNSVSLHTTQFHASKEFLQIWLRQISDILLIHASILDFGYLTIRWIHWSTLKLITTLRFVQQCFLVFSLAFFNCNIVIGFSTAHLAFQELVRLQHFLLVNLLLFMIWKEERLLWCLERGGYWCFNGNSTRCHLVLFSFHLTVDLRYWLQLLSQLITLIDVFFCVITPCCEWVEIVRKRATFVQIFIYHHIIWRFIISACMIVLLLKRD